MKPTSITMVLRASVQLAALQQGKLIHHIVIRWGVESRDWDCVALLLSFVQWGKRFISMISSYVDDNDICISEYNLDKPILKSILQLSKNKLFLKVLGIKMVEAFSFLLTFYAWKWIGLWGAWGIDWVNDLDLHAISFSKIMQVVFFPSLTL